MSMLREETLMVFMLIGLNNLVNVVNLLKLRVIFMSLRLLSH